MKTVASTPPPGIKSAIGDSPFCFFEYKTVMLLFNPTKLCTYLPNFRCSTKKTRRKSITLGTSLFLHSDNYCIVQTIMRQIKKIINQRSKLTLLLKVVATKNLEIFDKTKRKFH